jgi:hypothetical protein
MVWPADGDGDAAGDAAEPGEAFAAALPTDDEADEPADEPTEHADAVTSPDRDRTTTPTRTARPRTQNVNTGRGPLGEDSPTVSNRFPRSWEAKRPVAVVQSHQGESAQVGLYQCGSDSRQ